MSDQMDKDIEYSKGRIDWFEKQVEAHEKTLGELSRGLLHWVDHLADLEEDRDAKNESAIDTTENQGEPSGG